MVCGVWRPGQLEEPERSLGHAGQRGPHLGDGVSGPRPATGCVLESGVRSQTVDEPGGADKLVDTIFDRLQERSRLKITKELWRFDEVDNHGSGVAGRVLK